MPESTECSTHGHLNRYCPTLVFSNIRRGPEHWFKPGSRLFLPRADATPCPAVSTQPASAAHSRRTGAAGRSPITVAWPHHMRLVSVYTAAAESVARGTRDRVAGDLRIVFIDLATVLTLVRDLDLRPVRRELVNSRLIIPMHHAHRPSSPTGQACPRAVAAGCAGVGPAGVWPRSPAVSGLFRCSSPNTGRQSGRPCATRRSTRRLYCRPRGRGAH